MDLRGFYKVIEATMPAQLPSLTVEQLEGYHAFLAQFREGGWLTDDNIRNTCADRLALLRREVELRRMAAHAETQHTEAMELGKNTLKVAQDTLTAGQKAVYWAKWAVVAAVVIPIAVALIAEIPLSKLLPARSSQPLPELTPQTLPTSETPMSPEQPSATMTASPTPSTEATPE